MKIILPVLLTGVLLLGVAQASSPLPDIGSAAGDTLSPTQERELGRRMMTEVRRKLPLLEDPEVVDYVRDLGGRLAGHSDAPELPFEFFVVDHPAINAFAMPGGYIGINSGLILNARSESELAAVLAHEIAHVTQRHIARGVAASQRVNFQTLALLLAAAVIGSQDAQAGSAAAMASMAGGVQQQLNFSRTFEQEADNIGIRMLADAGFDPHGMPRFFDRLAQSLRYSEQPPEFLSTHPVTATRITESAARAERSRPARIFESDGFALMQARLLALKASSPTQAVSDFQARLASAGGDTAAIRYGLALALIGAREFDKARAHLDALIKQRGEALPFLLARARLERESGRMELALAKYRQLTALYPDSYPARYHYADALLAAGQAEQAYQVLVRAAPSREPALYFLLARAASEARKGAEAQLAMCEYHYLRGDLRSALTQLDQVLRSQGADPHQVARATARRDELQQEYTEQLKDG